MGAKQFMALAFSAEAVREEEKKQEPVLVLCLPAEEQSLLRSVGRCQRCKNCEILLFASSSFPFFACVRSFFLSSFSPPLLWPLGFGFNPPRKGSANDDDDV